MVNNFINMMIIIMDITVNNFINTMKITINKVYGKEIKNMINIRQKPTLPFDKFLVQLVIQNLRFSYKNAR